MDDNEKARKKRGDNTFQYGDELMTMLTKLAPNYGVVYRTLPGE